MITRRKRESVSKYYSNVGVEETEINNKKKQHVHRCTHVNLFAVGRENIENQRWSSNILLYASFDITYENSYFCHWRHTKYVQSIKQKILFFNS